MARPTGDLPPIPVLIEPLLPPGQLEPHPRSFLASPWLGGYRLLHADRRPGLACRPGGDPACRPRETGRFGRGRRPRPLTLADRLRPLVDAAVAGELGAGEHAELERLLDRLLAPAARAGAGRRRRS